MSNKKLKVLLVEDERDAAELYCNLLNKMSVEELLHTDPPFSGVEVSLATTQCEAEDLAAKHVYDLILLDTLYPDHEGGEPANNGTRWVGRLRTEQPMALIALFTAYGYSTDVFEAVHRSDVIYLQKHLRWSELMLRLRMAFSWRQDPHRFPSLFISYSNSDAVFAERLYTDLSKHGLRCWFAPHEIQGGKKIYEQIDQAIHRSDRLLLILSKHSMNSEWVNTEISKARKRELRENRRMLFPVRLVDFETLRDWECFDGDTGKDSAREIREYFIPDFRNWMDTDTYDEVFRRLLRDLRAEES